VAETATVAGYQGTNSTVISFSIGNGDDLLNSGNSAYNNLGAPGSDFDWGLPFFFGRTTYINVSNSSPYWAF
jgi:hypothetical protein